MTASSLIPIAALSGSALFKLIKVGNILLQHRVVLAPMTRLRNDQNHVPTDLVREHYIQRATPGGLLITEATMISPMAGGVPHAPGIYTKEQIEGWKKVTSAIHDKQGYIYLQLWHIGRGTSSKFLPNGALPVSASAIAIKDKNMLGDDYEVPRPLAIDEIKETVKDYAQAAKNAMEAGFDGVEIHGANGYLIDQFINTSSNKRTDEYGGSIENRARFAIEVVDAVVDAVGPERTGIRLSPWSNYLDMKDETPYDTWGYIVSKIQERHPNLAYVHFVEPRNDEGETAEKKDSLDPFRAIWKGKFISADGYTAYPERAAKIADETGNLVAFGRIFTSNPDLVQRLKNGWSLRKYDRETFYGGNHVGYTDYPVYSPEVKA
ncbi:hypothetical protein VTP01DRAFT_10131 [Rhizomucor pusillus]|uniref:uncharacterized protein n=1 Tax=Rhizomucor pusillus TaxID=4840 RepID=UPI003743DFCB